MQAIGEYADLIVVAVMMVFALVIFRSGYNLGRKSK